MIVKQRRRQVPVPGIWQQCYDRLPFIFRPACQDGRRLKRRAGRYPHQDSLADGKRLALCKCILILNGDNLIVYLRVERLRDKACADSLDLMRSRRPLGQHRASGRLDGYDFDIRVLLL